MTLDDITINANFEPTPKQLMEAMMIIKHQLNSIEQLLSKVEVRER